MNEPCDNCCHKWCRTCIDCDASFSKYKKRLSYMEALDYRDKLFAGRRAVHGNPGEPPKESLKDVAARQQAERIARQKAAQAAPPLRMSNRPTVRRAPRKSFNEVLAYAHRRGFPDQLTFKLFHQAKRANPSNVNDTWFRLLEETD